MRKCPKCQLVFNPADQDRMKNKKLCPHCWFNQGRFQPTNEIKGKEK